MGGKNKSVIFKEEFGLDYDETLRKLHDDDHMEPWQISQWFKEKYSFAVAPQTVAGHLKKILHKPKKIGRRSVASQLQAQGVSDYKALLQSLSSLDKDGIAQEIRMRYGVTVQAGTIVNHCKEFGIELGAKRSSSARVREIEDIRAKIEFYGKHHNDPLVSKTLPLTRYFNSTSHVGYVYFRSFPSGVFEIISKLIVISTTKARVEVSLSAYHENMSEDTEILYEVKIDPDELRTFDDLNFRKRCISLIKPFVSELEKMNEVRLTDLLVTRALKPKGMTALLERSATAHKGRKEQRHEGP